MGRWSESWLPGASPAGDPAEQPGFPGERFDLPPHGPGAAAGFGRRLVALLVDIVLAALVAGLFTAPELPRNWSLLAWFLLTVVPVALFGATAGMTAFGIRVARVDGSAFVGVPRAVLRTVLLFFVLPAVLRDDDGRGLHDRAAGTIVLRTR